MVVIDALCATYPEREPFAGNRFFRLQGAPKISCDAKNADVLIYSGHQRLTDSASGKGLAEHLVQLAPALLARSTA